MKCFYHSADFDGKCAGAIVKLAYHDCELIGIDYGNPFPWEVVGDGELVFMVDFTIQPHEEMWRLRERCTAISKLEGRERTFLVWIDHHKTALEWAAAADFDCPGLRLIDKAGCELTWLYLHGTGPACLPMPEAVALLGRYDVWDHKDERVLPFQYGMQLLNPDAKDVAVWQSLFDGTTNIAEVVNKGLIIQQHKDQSHAGVNRMAGFDLEWEGLHWTVINGPYRGSMVHKSRFDPQKHDAMLGFYWTGNQWMFSLTTNKPDVDISIIAKKHGGGGHKGAAGFQSAVLPFVLG